MRCGDSSGFITRGTSLEPMSADLGIDQTPIEDFFVCKVDEVPLIDGDAWALEIDGDAAAQRATLDLGALEALPHHQVAAWLECAGNGRSLFGLVGGRSLAPEANDTPWMLGAIGMATWEGPTLRSVLELAKVGDAAWIGPQGSDHPNNEGEPVRMCLPIEKALHHDTIVALRMDGAPLEPAHGFPARLLVPGWVGAYSVKWLERIELSSSWIPSWRADEYYRLRTADGADRGPATSHPVKSSLALPWPAVLDPGQSEVTGYARAAGVPIEVVEWQLDDGPWRPAELIGPNSEWSWSPFRLTLAADPGDHTIRTRATDAGGNRQPDAVNHHPNGLLWNAVIPHPIHVRGGH